MKRELETAVDPLDANLEKVLPGVQQWHATHHQALTKMSSDYQELKNFTNAHLQNQGSVMKQIADRQQQQAEQMRQAFHNAAMAFSPTEPNSPEDHSLDFDLDPIEEDEAEGANYYRAGPDGRPRPTDQETAEDQKKFKMKPKHMSLHDLYDEWYGLGIYDDGLGGVAGREQRYDKRWRKHLENNHFSRTKAIVAAIEAFAKEKNCSASDACSYLQEAYNSKNNSVGNFRTHCQNMGLIPKGKQRGRQAKEKIHHVVSQ